jgi:hypothetical protein
MLMPNRWNFESDGSSEIVPDGEFVRWGDVEHLFKESPTLDSLITLLDEVRQCFTRDDDLPGDLLSRIDAAIDGVQASSEPLTEGELIRRQEEGIEAFAAGVKGLPE